MAWATRLPGGPLKGFFIPSVSQGRDMVELMQRLALEPTTVTIDRNWDVNCWGIGDFYGHEYRGDRDDFQTVYGYVEEELTERQAVRGDADSGPERLVAADPGLARRHPAAREGGRGARAAPPLRGRREGPSRSRATRREGDERIWELSPLVGVPDDFVSERGYPELNAGAIDEAQVGRRARATSSPKACPWTCIPSGARAGASTSTRRAATC